MTDTSRLIRNASPEEIDFYTNKLYPIQDRAMEAFTQQEFYLTGGTALSRFHFKHRYSDDLDFFFDGYNFPKERFNISYREAVNNLDRLFQNIEITIDGEFFKRLFVTENNTSLKIEFIYENFKTVGEKNTYKKIAIDSKENICANKIGTVMDRRAVKDFVDLYYLLDEISLTDAISWSEYKKVPPDYEGLMMGIGDLFQKPHLLEGQVLLCRPLSIDVFIDFIRKLLEKLVNHAKSR